MSFVCTATRGGFGVEIFTQGDAAITVVNIGHDDVLPLNYSAVIGFDTLPGGDMELYFQIVEADGASGEENIFWSGRETRFIELAADRKSILEAILTGLRELVSQNGADTFTWFTYEEYLPRRALVKFDFVKEVIEACGYTVTSKRLRNGRKGWRASR